MKIRNGFVSNSSSSSFCIIGVQRGWRDDGTVQLIKALEEAEGKNFDYDADNADYFSSGTHEGEVVTFYGDDCTYYAGVDAEPLLQSGNIPAACEAFQKLVKKKLKVEIPLNKIGFYYGEVGNG